jgi:hypothetical protein
MRKIGDDVKIMFGAEERAKLVVNASEYDEKPRWVLKEANG